MPLLSFEQITKSFFGVQVLHKVSFTLEKGQILGLIGENGSGKSTAMNILGGVHQPDSGRMRLDGVDYAPLDPRQALARGIAFIHQELNLFENLSIEENIFIGGFPRILGRLPLIDRRSIRRCTRALLDLVEIKDPPGTLVGSLSQGERQLVEIAKALNTAADLIIFDEPTTSLTRREVEKLFGIIRRLKAQGIAVIYISHVLSEVQRLCDEIVVLRDGAVVGQGTRAEMPVERMIPLMVGRNIDSLFPPRTHTPQTTPVLEVAGVSQPGIVKDLNFFVRSGEIVGLAGLMGSGRSETARILFGLDPHGSGDIRMSGASLAGCRPEQRMDLGMAFLTEDRRAEGLLMNAPIADSLGLPNLGRYATKAMGWIDRHRLLADSAEMARRVQLNTTELSETLARNLSGGNQQKVVLGKWLMRRPSLFILDEPTRGVDIGARHEIYKIIDQLVMDGAGVLMISSEMEELIGMCDRILVMCYGQISGAFERDEFDEERILEAAMHRERPMTAAS
jgi:ABC-type sugar transport system ATPase subunit